MATTTTTTVSTGRRFRFDAASLTAVHWVAIAAALVSGVAHLYLYYLQEAPVFLFAGVVFLAAVVGVLFDVYRVALYALGIPFTLGQIAIWYAVGMPDVDVAVIDKPAQVVLVVALAWLLYAEYRARRTR